MAHQRQTIRDAVAATLVAANTAASGRVYPWRLNNWTIADLPALAVYARSETAESLTIHSPRILDRMLDIAVEVVTSGSLAATAVDDLAAQAEAALAGNRTLSGTCKDSQLTQTDIELDGSGETVIATATLLYRVEYTTLDTNPSALA